MRSYKFQLKFLDIVCRWPGSTHDSTMFTNSALFNRFETGEFGIDSLALVDSAYGPHTFVCKPLRDPQTLAEKKYQRAQILTRNTVERSFGVLKNRFNCLSFGMRFREVAKVQDIIIACCILHNMCIENEDDFIQQSVNDIQKQMEIGELYIRSRALNQRLKAHQFLINNHFNEVEQQN